MKELTVNLGDRSYPIVIGSNLYNLLAVYSLPGLLAPGAVAESVIYRDFPVMLVFTGVLFILGFGLRKAGQINRVEGLALLLAFAEQGLPFEFVRMQNTSIYPLFFCP